MEDCNKGREVALYLLTQRERSKWVSTITRDSTFRDKWLDTCNAGQTQAASFIWRPVGSRAGSGRRGSDLYFRGRSKAWAVAGREPKGKPCATTQRAPTRIFSATCKASQWRGRRRNREEEKHGSRGSGRRTCAVRGSFSARAGLAERTVADGSRRTAVDSGCVV